MERDMQEILLSQERMKQRNNSSLKNKGLAFNVKLATAFEKEIQKVANWEKQAPNVEILRVNYKKMLENPDKEIERVNQFLDGVLNTPQMNEVVDPNLYREQLKKTMPDGNG